jgi:HK97 family phage portal protein
MRLWPFSRKQGLPTKRSGGSVLMSGGDGWSPKSADAWVAEGYQLNAIVYRAVNEIARSLSDMTVELHRPGRDGQAEILSAHPVLDLLRQPNPMMGYDTFIHAAFTDYLLHGEMAIYAPQESRPAEIWTVDPREIKVVPGSGRIPARYLHKAGAVETSIEVDRLTGRSQLLFYRMYNPADPWRGQSPLMAAGLAADTHNAGVQWNYRLLKNSARPSGLVTFEQEGVDPDTIDATRRYFRDNVQGDANAGGIPMLFGGAKWTPMDNSPRDMDFLNTQKEAAKLIAAAFGVPLPLIDTDATTYNNMEQAKERFYTDTLIPMFRGFLNTFGNWLLPMFEDGLQFAINMDDIPALEASRGRLFDRMVRAKMAGLITVDEAREAIGYDPLGGAAGLLDPLAGMFPDAGAKARDDAALAYGANVQPLRPVG